MRLIDADAIKYNYLMCPETNDPAKMAVSKDKIDAMPPVQTEQKTGHWIAPKYYPTQFTFTCSKCGYKQSFNGKFKFCPNCGADMRGYQNG